ncbi:MarC family protein [Denitromonas sp.]|uniref:MarC family protein n=1 Tax=Denitromonas sp. TaxID=2734609 RepID=UPI003A8790CE
MQAVLQEFVLFWAVLDPIGTLPVFLSATVGMGATQRRRVAVRAVLVSAALLGFFAVSGEVLLDAMGIPLATFAVAGGLVLFAFAMSMIFFADKPQREIEQIGSERDIAICPLAFPSIASPGAILAVVMAMDHHRGDQAQQFLSGGCCCSSSRDTGLAACCRSDR